MSHDINLLLKEIINKIIEKYSNFTGIKSKIARILMGTNNQPAFLKWINDETNSINFGIKPLSRIAESAGYKVLITFVDKQDTELTKICQDQNIKFVGMLQEAVEDYLSNNHTQTNTTKSSEQIVAEYDNIFNGIIPFE